MRYLLLALLIATTGAQAELYRWTDENGRVHFGDKPPGDDEEAAESIAKPKVPKIGQEDTRAIEERTRALLENEERQELELENRQSYVEQQKQKRRDKCTEARDRLRRLEGAFSYRDTETGELYTVTEREAEEDRAQLRNWIAKYCEDY